ncbi:hypothetical protein NDU88_000866 [Pleurodeles waltl]|uniref:Uncharacterized protein n=1 Tax=Pleurodeles waltl TaxID=8319 RepID=A0AAV7TG88_PLEWA|nr:hypothetical protein NDU88_000866 [Pleurodeles waltl]
MLQEQQEEGKKQGARLRRYTSNSILPHRCQLILMPAPSMLVSLHDLEQLQPKIQPDLTTGGELQSEPTSQPADATWGGN